MIDSTVTPPAPATSPFFQSARGLAQSKTPRAGRARHSVRAGAVNPNALVSKRRRAEDCPPYQRASVLDCGGSPPLFPGARPSSGAAV